MRIPQHLLDQLIAHAVAEAPLECCGMIGARHGQAVAVYPATNAALSEYRYEIDGQEQCATILQLEQHGLDLGGIYHSHTHAPPEPSPMDVATAFYPWAVYLIVGVAGQVPEVRAWRIVAGQVTEEPLEIVAVDDERHRPLHR